MSKKNIDFPYRDLDDIPFNELTMEDIKGLKSRHKDIDDYDEGDYYFRKLSEGELIDDATYYRLRYGVDSETYRHYVSEDEPETVVQTSSFEEADEEEEYDLTLINPADYIYPSKKEKHRLRLKLSQIDYMVAWWNGFHYKKGDLVYKKNTRMCKAFQAGRRVAKNV